MRILYHAINGAGLGHLMRLSAIATAVRAQAPHVHQLIATNAPMGGAPAPAQPIRRTSSALTSR